MPGHSAHSRQGKRCIDVRLLLPIHRSGTQADAAETVELAAEFSKEENPIELGLDLSGNSMKSSFVAFQSHFEKARSLGLKSTVHIGEKSDDRTGLGAALQNLQARAHPTRRVPLPYCSRIL